MALPFVPISARATLLATLMVGALATLSLVSGLTYLWRGYRRNEERRVMAGMIAETLLLGCLGWLLPGLLPYALGLQMGSLVGLLWVWSDRTQVGVLIGVAVTLGVLAHLGDFLTLAMMPIGVAILVWGRSIGILLPAFEPSAARGKIRPYQHHALLCYGDRCQLRGADLLWNAMRHTPAWKTLAGVRVTTSECLGYCRQGPVIWVEPEGHLETAVRVRDLPQFFDRPERFQAFSKDTR